MINAAIDGNNTPSLILLSAETGTPIVRAQANSSNALLVETSGVGSNYGGHIARDENYRTVLFAISATDGVSLVPIYAQNGYMKVILK